MKFSLFAASALLLVGCTYGGSVKTGDITYAPVPQEHVAILFVPPDRPYKEIGMVSARGAHLAADARVYAKLQKAAADIGADAVIVTSAQDKVNYIAPGTVDTSGTAYTTGSVQGNGDYATGQATTQYSGTSYYTPPQAITGLHTDGIAIKYTSSSNTP
jgi:hypothetical protein